MPGLTASETFASVTTTMRDDAALEAHVLGALDRGDRDDALTALMREFGAPVYRYCRQLLGDATIAEDAHQMVFAQAYEHFATFQRRSSVRAWLLTIAHHRCLDVIKARQRFDKRFSLEGEAPERAHPTPSAEAHLAAAALARAVEDCLAQLPPHVRMAVVLRYREGFPYDEIAQICGERAGTVQARVARAMPQLRRCLEAKEAAP